MPLNVVIGLAALLVALIAYSLGVWGAWRSKGATPLHIASLWVGVLFDIAATASMSYSIGWRLEASLHTYLALAAMFGMIAIASVATVAWVRKNDALRAALAKWAVAPWALWVAVFAWGMIARAPRRG